jgi:hypothetical protein
MKLYSSFKTASRRAGYSFKSDTGGPVPLYPFLYSNR